MVTELLFDSRDSILKPLNEKTPFAEMASPTTPVSNSRSLVMEELSKVTGFELENAANTIREELQHYNSPSALPFAIEAIKQLYVFTLSQLKRSPVRLNKGESLTSPSVLLKIQRKRQDLLLEAAQGLVNPSGIKTNSLFGQSLCQCRPSREWVSNQLLKSYPVHCESLGLGSVKSSQPSLSEPPAVHSWAALDSITKLIPEQISRPQLEPGSIDEENLLETIEHIEAQLSRLKEQVLRYRNQRIFHQRNVKRNVNPFEEMI